MSSKRDATTAGGDEDGPTVENSEGGTTVALQRKRSRRVSFAENTSIHFFDRDDEYNEALVAAEESSADKIAANKSEELKVLLEFFQSEDVKGVNKEDRMDADNESGDEDEDISDMPLSFLRPSGSPSPGSTVGSAASNDEDIFFGPVAANFICPGRLSDSAASDDNHDFTMDTATFSMHFRSLARSDLGDLRTPTGVHPSNIAKSDSGVDVKTPAGVHLSFEQKTPIHDNVGSSMELTVLKKPISHSSSGNKNCGSGSSDMSLIVDNSSKYNYGRLPPELEALITEVGKVLPTVSSSHGDVASQPSGGSESKYLASNGSGLMDSKDDGNEISFQKKLGKGKSSSVSAPKNGFSSNSSDAVPLENLVYNSDSSPGPSRKVKTSSAPDILSPAVNIQHESSMEFISSSPAEGRQSLTSSASPAKHRCIGTPLVESSPSNGRQVPEKGSPSMYTSVVTPQEKTGSFLTDKDVMHDESSASIQKSISKLKFLETSPFSFSLTTKLKNVTIGALDFPNPSHTRTFLVEGMNGFQNEYLDRPISGSERHLLSYPKNKEERALQDDDQVEDPSGRNTIVKAKHDLHRSKSPTAAKMVPAATDYLSPEVGHEYVRGKKALSTPHNFAPLDEALKAKMVSPDYPGQFLDNSVLRGRLKNLQNFFLCHGLASKGGITNANISSAVLDESGTSSLGSRLWPRQPAMFNNSNLIDCTSADDFNSHQLGTIQNIANLGTPTEKLNNNLQTGMDCSMFRSDHPGRESEAGASVQGNMNELIVSKNLLDNFTQNPSKKYLLAISSKISGMPEVEDVPSPFSDKVNSLGHKRKKKRALEGKHGKETAANIGSPKVQKIREDDVAVLDHHKKDDQRALIFGHGLKHWTNIYLKLVDGAENVLCTSIDKLNVSLIELLEDYLVCLRRSKAYGIISNKIIDQKKASVDVLHYERVGEARMLLGQIILEKGKLKLVCAKRQKLLETLRQLNTGIEETQTLKVGSLSKCTGDAQADIVDYQNLFCSKHQVEVNGDKVTAMKLALEALDIKVSNLIKGLTSSQKIKADPNYDIIESVNDHLIKKLCCHDIRADLKMWVVSEVKNRKGHHNIVLNYHGFISQSFNVTFAPLSDMVISNRLDETVIIKNFPRLDACTAFSFVLNAETAQKYLSSRSLEQEMQATSSVLGNLVDVVQEIQQANLELHNMTQAAFHCPSAVQLDLCICFFNFKSGKKVMLTLDLSCLKRGIYPSDILPSQLATGNRDEDSSPMIGEIRDAARGLRAGYMRILRLCRLVSHVVQTSKA